MQFNTFIATTAAPFVALGNPGAIYVENAPTQYSVVVAEARDAFTSKSGNSFPKPLAATTKGNRAVISVDTNAVSTPGAAVQALSRLRTFESWGPNWDGDGAPAPDREALKSAALMLGFLDTKLGHAPHVALNGDGEPTFTVLRGEFELSVTIVSENEAAYLVARGVEERAGLAEFDGRTLPPELASAVSELRPLVV